MFPIGVKLTPRNRTRYDKPKRKVMKVFLAFVYFFGSILIIFGLLWLMIWVAPEEYVLDREALSNHEGRFDHPDRIFPNFPLKEHFTFSGSIAGLAAKDENVKAGVLICKSKKEAEAVFKTYGSHVAKGISGDHPVQGTSIIGFRIPGFTAR